MSESKQNRVDPNRGVDYSEIPDAERNFACTLKISGHDLSNLMEALGTAGEYDLQDRVRESLVEITDEPKDETPASTESAISSKD
jgi:hypothetical protein